MLRICRTEREEEILGFKHTLQEHIDNRAKETRYEGGFRYFIPVSAEIETFQYLKDQFDHFVKKVTRKMCITINFIPQQTFLAMFPPTTPLPIDWKRHSTKTGTDIITISNNFESLWQLFGEGWNQHIVYNACTFTFSPRTGIVISRTKKGRFTLKMKFHVKSAWGNLLVE